MSVEPNILEPVSSKEKHPPLSVTHPELAKEADGWDPTATSYGSNQKVSWKCSVGHCWQEKISNRAMKKYGCPVCSGQQILSGFNDLATLRPEIANQAIGWDPSSIALHSNQKMKWKCTSGHIWESTVTNRVRRNDGCSVCSGHKTLAGFNDLASTDPLIASEADGWDPKTLNRSSNKVVGWKCSLGHSWKTRPATRVSGIGCPVCSGHKVLIGFNDLQTLFPEIARQADGWDPQSVTKSSDKVLPWICGLGHRSKSSVGNRTRGTGCGICANQIVQVGFNDLATTHPKLAKQAYGWDPTTVTPGSSKKNTNQWICKLGHIWKATVALRASGSHCPVCAGQKVWAGFNDLATTHPELAKQAYGWDPTTLMAGSDKVRAWKCEAGHIWKTRCAERKSGNNCPSCSSSGFDPNKDALLYFLEHQSWEMLQIGITNDPDSRLTKHARLGWELLELRGPMDGHLVQQWETAILRMLKAKGADLSNSTIAGKFDGYSEAWSMSTFEVKSIKELMKLTEEFEDESKV